MGAFDSLANALKNGNVTYTAGSAKNVNIEVGKGDSNIVVKGDSVTIKTGTGKQHVEVEGKDVDVSLDQNADADWDFSKDFDTVAVVGDAHNGKTSIDMGDGGGIVLAIAKDITINEGDAATGQEQSTIVWGENAEITAGDGGEKWNSTLDISTANGMLNQAKTEFSADIINAAEDEFVNSLIAGNMVRTSHELDHIESNFDEQMKKLQNKYNLDSKQMGVIKQLYDSGELFKELRPGVPQYAILQSATQKDANGNPKYVITKIDQYRESDGYIHGWGYGFDSNNTRKAVDDFKDCIKTYTKGDNASAFSALEEYLIEVKKIFNDTYKQETKVDGMQSYQFNVGNADSTYTNITIADGGTTNLKAQDANSHYAKINDSYVYVAQITNATSEEKDGKVWAYLDQTGRTAQSPLVLDMNRDGKVSATSAYGVDVDGNGTVDGAATNGDKMLAMSDTNGNGKIDGAEVFGNKTVSPFTGKAYNAANGFEALKMLAQEADQYTNVHCYKNGKVDLPALKLALASVGVELGYISDENVTQLEALEDYDVASITVDEYKEVDDSGDVQHNQQGTYTTNDGTEHSVDDVWFKIKGKTK